MYRLTSDVAYSYQLASSKAYTQLQSKGWYEQAFIYTYKTIIQWDSKQL